MLGENRDVVQVNLVRISEDVCLREVGVGHLLTHHFGLGIFKLRMSAERFTQLLVLVGVCHFIYLMFK